MKSRQAGFTVVEVVLVISAIAIIGVVAYFITRHIHNDSSAGLTSQEINSIDNKVGSTNPRLNNTYSLGGFVLPDMPSSFTLLNKVPSPGDNPVNAQANYLSSLSSAQLVKAIDEVCKNHNFLVENGNPGSETVNNSPPIYTTNVDCLANSDEWNFYIISAKDIGYYTGQKPNLSQQQSNQLSKLNYINIVSSGPPVFSRTAQ